MYKNYRNLYEKQFSNRRRNTEGCTKMKREAKGSVVESLGAWIKTTVRECFS
jgi:hypothetical protein